MATTLAELGNAEWAATPKGLPPGALMRPMGAVRGLPSGAMLRPVKQSSASSRQLSAGTQKLITHPAGKVTGIDEETGLPIVRRDEAHKPEKQPSAVSRQPSVEAESSDRPVVQGSNDAGEIRASAKEQEPVLQAMVAAVTAAVPGAKVEGVRVKKDASQETKAERGKPAETNIDNLGARLSASSRSALEKLRDHIEKKLPVENKSKITSNGLDMDQYSIRTGGKDAANQVSELQVGGKDQVDALKQTEPLYEKQKKAEARGDKAEAARLGAEITAMHKAATRDQFKAASQQVSKLASRQNETKAPVGETKYKFGNTQGEHPRRVGCCRGP